MNRKWSFSLLAWFAFSGPITYAAVITEARHVLVDPATSQASYHTTDWIFESDGQGGFLGRTIETTVESRIAGSFDLVLSTYIWNEDWPGQPVSTQYSEIWVGFENIELDTLDALIPLDLAIIAPLTAGQFAGFNGPCSFPQGPGASCSGWWVGPLSQISGTLSDQGVIFSGVIPFGTIGENRYTSYSISGFFPLDGKAPQSAATPSTLLLAIAGLVALRQIRKTAPRMEPSSCAEPDAAT